MKSRGCDHIVPRIQENIALRNSLLVATSFLDEMIAEFSSISHNPVDDSFKTKVPAGLFGFNPLVPFDFSGLGIQIFFEVHGCTKTAKPHGRSLSLILSQIL